MQFVGPLGHDTQVDTEQGLHYRIIVEEFDKLTLLMYIETGQLE